MRIKRAIISPLVTLGIVGSIATGVAVPLATAATSSTPVAVSATPLTFVHW
jgi:hypothetical protein